MLRGKRSNRGQVIIIFVFVVIALIGFAGLAVDGGNIYADRRHAQNAADTAAMAAAVTKNTQQQGGASGCSDLITPTTCGALVQTAALNMAATNGYNNDLVDDTVEVHIPPVDGAYANCNSFAFNCHDYIEVIINTNVNTFFARVLGIGQLHNRVEAVALTKYSPSSTLYGGNALVELDPTGSGCPGQVRLQGGLILNLDGGGIFVNSNNSTCAFEITSGCITLNVTNIPGVPPASGIEGVGGQSNPSCPTAPVMAHTSPYQFPPDQLFAEPAACGQTPVSSPDDADGYAHLNPGHYASLPPAKNTRLYPGVYCVDGLIKTTNPNSHLVGSNVFIYIKPGGSFSLQGGNINLTAPTTGQYAGYLIYVATDFVNGPQSCSINGGTGDVVTGVIYAPFCDVTVNGGSGTFALTSQIIGYTLKLTGSATLTFIYDRNNPVITPVIDWTGLFH